MLIDVAHALQVGILVTEPDEKKQPLPPVAISPNIAAANSSVHSADTESKTGSHVVQRCTDAELVKLQNVADIGAE